MTSSKTQYIVCDCAALYIGHLVVDELRGTSTAEKQALKLGQRNIASQMPRHVTSSLEEVKETGLVASFSWSAALDISSSFILRIRPSVADSSQTENSRMHYIFRASPLPSRHANPAADVKALRAEKIGPDQNDPLSGKVYRSIETVLL